MKIRVQALVDDADNDLAKCLPILASANEAISHLTKKDLAEVRSYANPPKDIMTVMSAVLTVLGKVEPDWATVKKETTDPNFMKRLINLDKDNIPETTVKRVEMFTK